MPPVWRPLRPPTHSLGSRNTGPGSAQVTVWVAWVGCLCLAGALAVLLAWPLMRVPLLTRWDYNEGWNAYHAREAIRGEPLYRPDLTPVNYPPLSFYLVGGAGQIFGNYVIAGRVISILSFAVSSLGVGLIVATMGGSIGAAAIGGFLAAALIAAVAPGYIGMNDPELLAHAFLLTALMIYVRRAGRNETRVLWAVAALVSVGLFIKHNPLAVPLAITWDLRRDRRSLATWCMALGTILSLMVVVTQLGSGATFIPQLLQPRIVSWAQWQRVTVFTFSLIKPVCLAVAICLVLGYGDRRRSIVAAYFAASVGVGMLFAAGDGTYRNVYFDSLFAMSIAVGVQLASWRAQPLRYAALIVLVLWSPVRLAAAAAPRQERLREEARELEPAMAQDIRFLSGVNDPVLCETLVLCFAAGRAFTFDPFVISQQVLTGRRDEQSVLRLIESHHFAAIQLDNHLPDTYTASSGSYTRDVVARGLFTENILTAIGRYYRVARSSASGDILLPR